MRLSDFDYDLPRELIAQTPAHPRNHAQLLVYNRATREIIDDYFYNLGEYLPAGSTLVLNNSKVEKCRLLFGKTEIFVLESADAYTVKALVRPGKRFRTGSVIELGGGLKKLSVETLSVDPEGVRILKLSRPLDDPWLAKHKHTPFPPYITANEKMSAEYQTVYAEPLGSKAAPTAGLHFTAQQLGELKRRHPVAELTLHVGLGTFAPVKADDIARHKLHSEEFELSPTAARILNKAGHITAVGTTSARTLESLPRPFKPGSGTTNIFIMPGYKFHSIDALVTNFHLPKSTLMMLVTAFNGSITETRRLYEHAVKNKYRFYSFGDAMLIL